MNCGDNRVIRLAGSDVQAKAKPGDVALIFYASEKGKELVLNGASCQADGSILVESVSIEPDVSVPVDICALPMAKEKLAGCR